MTLLISLLVLSLAAVEVRASGYLYDPPQRSSAWRYGYDVPPNYTDMGLNCGGRIPQWDLYDGKCGLCGDPWNGQRRNEAGGIYAKGIITGRYSMGDVMVARVKITAYNRGWFEFRICAVNDKDTKVTQECLDQNLLSIVGNDSSRYDITSLGIKESIFDVHLQLPAEMTCSQCVLQWTYYTGNHWGCDESGCGLGLGPQEMFINCADIAISDPSAEPPANC